MFDWFKKKKKTKEMISTEERLFALKEDLGRYQYYQWIRGENAGKISEYRDVCIEHDGAVFIEFFDGTRCNVEALGEMMLKTNNPDEMLEIEPPQPKASTDGTKVRITDKQIESPLTALLKKQKPNPVNVDISIELNIPAPELYKVICGSFDNAEDEIADYVVQGINMDAIKAIIKEGLKKYYA